MPTPSGFSGGIMLLREVATSPSSALYVAQREVSAGTELLAVKLLRNAPERAVVVGLQQRAAKLRMLRHRHIVTSSTVLDVGGTLGLVSPFVDGIDLLEWIEILRENNVRMPPRVVCEVLRGVAVALDAAMNRVPWGSNRPLKFVHCDVKPTNIMITRDGEIKVLDFGTGASQLDGKNAPITRHARNYIAPERSLGRPPSHASDVYALGILGIELIHDSWMHVVPSAPVEHGRHLTKLLRSSELRLRTSADQQTLRSLLLRMARHSPGARPTAAVVAQTLRRLADRAPGPSLESFSHESAAPWLMTIPEDPETALIVQVAPVPLETIDIPTLPKIDSLQDSATNTLTNTDFKAFITEDPSAVFLRGASAEWDDDEDSVTQSIALKTGEALRAMNNELEDAKTLPDAGAPRHVDDDGPTQMEDVTELENVLETERATEVEEVIAEVLSPEPQEGLVVHYEDVRIQEASFEAEGVSAAWVAVVALCTTFLGFAAVMAVLMGIALGLYLATVL